MKYKISIFTEDASVGWGEAYIISEEKSINFVDGIKPRQVSKIEIYAIYS